MRDLFPAVAETAATGATAELFADIRETVGVRVVNLVWRHLATIEGALPSAWSAVKPLYVQGMVDRAAVRFREEMVLPTLDALAGDEPASVDAVLASYDHSNTINLLALGALTACLHGDVAAVGVPERGPRLPAPDVTLPKLASAEDVSPATWATVLRLNCFGDREQVILASMYRHLAHAPAFLVRLEMALRPAEEDGSLLRAIAANKRAAYERSRVLARAISTAPRSRGAEIEAAVSLFVDHAIGKMVTICRAIRIARNAVSRHNGEGSMPWSEGR
ncbi:hypothetical protein SAMN02745126_01403 [Enhydrobacter aerosaccus]|uniref:Uncharacterized protein n=1 Tax=Enhydrobacter aerosaccus TaxID=225324 RepID=A0A1T4L807_9HYPH|nr:hypothetical protein [Enhydrobacter aerosaccus]SJZ50804.1 hypothetical protein SAMN02745126_01403 [Enhydrobacter aerosaccus]